MKITEKQDEEELALADAEHLGAAGGALTLSCRSPVLQGNRPGILYLDFPPAFHAICLSHRRTSNTAFA